MGNKEILVFNDYGKVELTLKERMDDIGMSRNALARKINVRFEVVDKWYNNQVEKLDLDILSRICFVLNCKVSDIIKYVN